MDEKARAKAMKTPIVFQEGDNNNKLVVVGVGVDTAKMATRLKKLMGNATITSANDVEASGQKKDEKKEEKKEEMKEEKKVEPKAEAVCPPYYWLRKASNHLKNLLEREEIMNRRRNQELVK